MSRVVCVERIVRIKYEVPVEDYPGMTDEEIIAWEKDEVDVSIMLDWMNSEDVLVHIAERDT